MRAYPRPKFINELLLEEAREWKDHLKHNCEMSYSAHQFAQEIRRLRKASKKK